MNTNIKLDSLPALPGVYLFKNHDHQIIYIGKAVSIRHRVKSYFQDHQDPHESWKLKNLVKEIAFVDYIIAKTEEDALILEAQLIKEKQPKFNVLLKDGQPFLYFFITNQELPKLKIARNKKERGTYFGPFLKKVHARRVMEFIEREFQLKFCDKKMPTGCLDYHMGLCIGTCMDSINLDEYKFRLELVKKLLSNDFESFTTMLVNKIAECSATLNFERAQHLYRYLENAQAIANTLKNHFKLAEYKGEILYVSSKLSRQKIRPSNIGQQLKEFLQLSKEPETIDCFDISHFQSRSLVGSCVRFTNGSPETSKFRRFRIKTLEQQNDYAALQEIVQRRYRNPDDIPDLILIDGGKGQLSAVQAVLPATANCVSLAKKEERLFTNNHKESVYLDEKSEVGQLLMAIRDYAHHFAISYHRKRREKIL